MSSFLKVFIGKDLLILPVNDLIHLPFVIVKGHTLGNELFIFHSLLLTALLKESLNSLIA